jgi:hypothetical protein
MVEELPEKLQCLLSICGMAREAFIDDFAHFAKQDKKVVEGWVKGQTNPHRRSVEAFVEYFKRQKRIEITISEFSTGLDDFRKMIEAKVAHRQLVIPLRFSHNEIANRKELTGKYKIYRCSLGNNRELTEEWLIIGPPDGSSHSINITIHNFPSSNTTKEQFDGVLFEVDGSLHGIVSSKESSLNRVRFLLFGAPKSLVEPVILYGLVLGTSLNENGNPVTACFVAGKILPASPLTELERQHILRINTSSGHRRAPGEETFVPKDLPEVDRVIMDMVSNDKIMQGGNSVLRADQASAHHAREYFRKLKEWYAAKRDSATLAAT